MLKAFLTQRAKKEVKEDKILMKLNKENKWNIPEIEEDILDHIQEEDILDHIQEEKNIQDHTLEKEDILDLILEEELEIQENAINVIKLDI